MEQFNIDSLMKENDRIISNIAKNEYITSIEDKINSHISKKATTCNGSLFIKGKKSVSILKCTSLSETKCQVCLSKIEDFAITQTVCKKNNGCCSCNLIVEVNGHKSVYLCTNNYECSAHDDEYVYIKIK